MTWEELKKHDLVMYSTVWCGDCRRFKMHLARHGVTYREIDIDAEPQAAAQLQARTGRSAIPFLEIDGRVMIRGWHSEKPGLWDDATFLAEAEHALKQEG